LLCNPCDRTNICEDIECKQQNIYSRKLGRKEEVDLRKVKGRGWCLYVKKEVGREGEGDFQSWKGRGRSVSGSCTTLLTLHLVNRGDRLILIVQKPFGYDKKKQEITRPLYVL
jgi:hypothetical protein